MLVKCRTTELVHSLERAVEELTHAGAWHTGRTTPKLQSGSKGAGVVFQYITSFSKQHDQSH